MIEFTALHLTDSIISQEIQYFPTFVCSKRIQKTYDAKRIPISMFYYIRKCNKRLEEKVNRCTFYANEVGQIFIFELEKKWCDKQKNYKSIWMYS